MMNVLVACEYSGIVRDSFEDAGWNAWSCDLLPTESEQTKASEKHFHGDILRILAYYKEANKDCLKENKKYFGNKDNCQCAVYDRNFNLYCLPL